MPDCIASWGANEDLLPWTLQVLLTSLHSQNPKVTLLWKNYAFSSHPYKVVNEIIVELCHFRPVLSEHFFRATGLIVS